MTKDLERIQANVALITRGRILSPDDLVKASPVVIPEKRSDQISAIVAHLFEPEDWIEFVSAVRREPGRKPSPASRGTIIRANQIDHELEDLLNHQVGTFIRINPVKQSPTGSTKSSDIVRFPHLLIEHDNLPKEAQAVLLASLELPIAVIIDSGGKSLHAWLSIKLKQRTSYLLHTKRIMSLLKPLGFDLSNSDASRLSRAPGFERTDDPEKGTTLQRLLYLNPKVKCDTPTIIDRIESSKKDACL